MGKITCKLEQDEYKLICFYRGLSDEKKKQFFHLVMALESLLVSRQKTNNVE